ncbi:hypothetical protein BLNAU_20018 [Blattamonas nauphoetae]|uniref:Uncharacterized protein n=1 Tax=Blattamonas nauphoetae TaxID=2049346 RepID=A0ABQ9X0H1_9EUKA|nr:hypothetical protein BLNAU_20018 [Blattamonas nauphoetae]
MELISNFSLYLRKPEQNLPNSDYWSKAGSIQRSFQRRLEVDSKHFSLYIEEWIKSRRNPDTLWRVVLTGILRCLTNSWVTSDCSCRTLWRNIKQHWATFLVDFKPITDEPNSYPQGITSREQCLHWLLLKFQKAAPTLLNQGFAHKVLEHMVQTGSDAFLFSDLKMLFVCLRIRRVRVLHFRVPLLEEGLEDTAEMVSLHSNEPIADYARQVLIIRPIASKLIPLMKFPDEYQPDVSSRFKEFQIYRMKEYDDACSSDGEKPIDVEKAAEKRAIRGQ